MLDELKKLEDAYAIIGDGTMSECLGKNCPSSCCWEKTTEGPGGKLSKGMVRLFGRPEIGYQETILKPSLTDLGVTINLGFIRERDHHSVIYVLNNCQNSDGSCRLQNRKPLRCRLFPFNLEPNSPIAKDCPRAVEICNDPELIRKIEEVRRLFGLE